MDEYQYFSDIIYDNELLKDISRRFTIKYIERPGHKPYFYKYRIKDWQSIENVAYDIYGSCDYIWAIMIANNIVDPINDWIKSYDEIVEYAQKKYGITGFNSVHHYECNGIKFITKQKTIIDARKTYLSGHLLPSDVTEAITEAFPFSIITDIKIITNIEYEMAENEKKRIINVIYPELIPYIQDEIKKIF